VSQTILHCCLLDDILHNKAEIKSTKISDFLTEVGKIVDVNATNQEGNTCLHEAVILQNIKFVKFCISKKADVNAKNNHGWTPLHYAALYSDTIGVEIISYLLGKEANADINAKANCGCTPLHLAATHDTDIVFNMLISHDADKHVKCKILGTPADIRARKNKTTDVNSPS
jgi:ankyrin repeat protein